MVASSGYEYEARGLEIWLHDVEVVGESTDVFVETGQLVIRND